MLDKSQLQAQGIHTIDTTPPPESQSLIALLKEHAPHAFSEGKLDLKSLANLLGIESSDAHYALSFLGKQEAKALYNAPATKGLRSEPDRSSDFDTTGNAIIIGDNLHALKTLETAYHEKVKMIYIDPPYNTGSDGFIYRDHFDADYRKILQEKGFIQTDEDGEEILSEALNFCQNTAGDKSHSGWLSFMYPRLRLARDLLRDDGVIFISIDDNEQANLKLLCDEIFGEHNFVGDFIRKTKSTTNDAKTGINYQHEFLLCYAKDKNNANLLGGEKDLSRYKNPDNDPNGAWISDNPSAKSGTMANGYFPITNPYTGKVDYPPKGRFWLFSKNTMQKYIDSGQIHFKKEHSDNERGFIYKRYLKDLKTTKKTFDSLKFTDNAFMNQPATKELIKLGLSEYFTYPKGVEFIKEIIKHGADDNDIVMDFFAGSGTTAHAVMELNAEDKNNGKQGNRKFILVQLDEAIDEKANKVAYDFCKSLGSENPTIADITIERVKRAGEKIREEKFKESNGDSTIDTGFKVFSLIDKQRLNPQEQDLLTLASSPLTPYQKAINLALHAGKTLDTRIQPVIESKLYRDESNFYLIACDKEVQKHLTADKNKDIFLSGYEDIAIQDLLNLQASQKTRLKVLF